MVAYSLELFGRFRLLRDGDEVPIRGRKTRALLTYLVLHGDRLVPRETLATLLWGNHPDDGARTNLRQTLFNLRKGLGDEHALAIPGFGDFLGIDQSRFDVDVWAFEKWAEDTDHAASVAATDSYRGDLLETFETGQAGFDGWLAAERARLRDLACLALMRLAEALSTDGRLYDAIDAAKRLVELDPFREDSRRLAMRLYSGAGRRVDAIREFQRYSDLLHLEFDIEPDHETLDLYRRIKGSGHDRIGAPNEGASPSAAKTSGADLVADHMLRGNTCFMRLTKQGIGEAGQIAARVIALDHRHAEAHVLAGWSHWMASVSGWSAAPQAKAMRYVDAALSLDHDSAGAYALAAKVRLWAGEFRDARRAAERAIALDPAFAGVYGHLGDILVWSGEPKQALPILHHGLAMAGDDHGWILTLEGLGYFLMREPDVAAGVLDRALARNPDYVWAQLVSAATHAELGCEPKARAAVARVRRLSPRMSLGFLGSVAPLADTVHRNRLFAALADAGLPS